MICTSILMKEHQVILRRMVSLAQALELPLEESEAEVRDTIEFIQEYADNFHHSKEELIYFKWMQEADPTLAEHGPLGCMVKEHDMGRKMVDQALTALNLWKQGDATQALTVRNHLHQFIFFINEHITKEDNILYPLAERLNETLQNGDATMLPKFENVLKSMPSIPEKAQSFEEALRSSQPAWSSLKTQPTSH